MLGCSNETITRRWSSRWSTWSMIATTARQPRRCEPERERYRSANNDLPVAHLGPLTVAGASTWEAIAQLATVVPVDRWAIVGGQMVAIHASLAGVDPPRVTDDGDVVVDVRVFGRQAMRDVASALVSIEFTSSESPEGVPGSSAATPRSTCSRPTALERMPRRSRRVTPSRRPEPRRPSIARSTSWSIWAVAS